jgi:hypothetical protein
MQPSRTFIIAIVLSIAALSVAAVAISKDDSSQLQGRWERSITGDSNVRGAAKAVKEIVGDKETVTYLNSGGDAVYATTASFKLENTGRVKLYTFSNFKVTKGAEQGADKPKSAVSYIYRIEGDAYHEAHGLLTDSPSGSKPGIVTWKRAK